MEEKKRVQFIDMVKGLTILSVAIYHIIAPGMFRTFFAGTIGSMFFSFFFFSGYFYSPGKHPIGESLKSRTKSLLGPFFSYSIGFWIVGSIILIAQGAETFLDAVCCLRNFYAGSIWNRTIQDLFSWDYHSLGKNYPFLADFWFLPALFFASIVFILLIEKVATTLPKQIASIVLLLLITGILRAFTISLPYNLQIVPFYASFLILGYICRKQAVFDKFSGAKAWIIGILISVLTLGFSAYFGYGTNLFRGTFEEPEPLIMVFEFALGTACILGLSVLCKQFEDTGINVDSLAYLGSHSIYLYMYHVFIAWIICRFTGFSMRYDPETMTVDTFEKSLLLAIVSIAISIAISVMNYKGMFNFLKKTDKA